MNQDAVRRPRTFPCADPELIPAPSIFPRPALCAGTGFSLQNCSGLDGKSTAQPANARSRKQRAGADRTVHCSALLFEGYIGAMRKPECLINVDLANALNSFLWKAGMHKEAYKELGFLCPECRQPVRPHHPRNGKTPRPHFEHLQKSECRGPESWR